MVDIVRSLLISGFIIFALIGCGGSDEDAGDSQQQPKGEVTVGEGVSECALGDSDEPSSKEPKKSGGLVEKDSGSQEQGELDPLLGEILDMQEEVESSEGSKETKKSGELAKDSGSQEQRGLDSLLSGVLDMLEEAESSEGSKETKKSGELAKDSGSQEQRGLDSLLSGVLDMLKEAEEQGELDSLLNRFLDMLEKAESSEGSKETKKSGELAKDSGSQE